MHEAPTPPFDELPTPDDTTPPTDSLEKAEAEVSATPETRCFNCAALLPPDAAYCHTCGQKHTDGKISVGQLWEEFADNYLHFNTKLPRTIGLLFWKPGFLTNQYFEGRHQHYLRPLRLFGVATVLLFAVFVWRYGKELDGSANLDFLTNTKINIALNDERTALDSTWQANRLAVAPAARQQLDSAFQRFAPDTDFDNDSADVTVVRLGGLENDLRIANRDFAQLSPDSIVNKYGVQGVAQRLLLRQSIKVMQDSRALPQQIFQQLSWMFLLLMPFFALLLKLLYVRHKRYYVEHLVFGLHLHAFWFLLLTLALVLSQWLTGKAVSIALLIGAVYAFRAMQVVYRQSFFKTFVKYGLLVVAYLALFVVGMVIEVLFSIATF